MAGLASFVRAMIAAGLAACLAFPAQAEGFDQPADEVLRQQYALPQSQFAQIAGETVHFVDEGEGPAIVLIHGSYASLRQWDYWAQRLSAEFRVVRFDLSPAGLSGPHPDNAYSIDQRIAAIDALADLLGLGRFTIVGTSSSGTPTAAYAALRPERVNGVVLSNIAVGPLEVDYSHLPPALLAAVEDDRTHPAYHLPEYWRQIMLLNVVDREAVTDELVMRWTYLNNRPLGIPGLTQAVVAGVSALRTPEDLAAITAPTLLLWSQEDHETQLAREGINALTALTVEDRTLIALGNCGHMFLLDCPARSLDAALPFLRRVSGQ